MQFKLSSLLATGLLGACLAFTLPAPAHARDLPDFTQLVEQVGPSVVNVRTTEKLKARAGNGQQLDPQMLEFLRRFGIQPPSQPKRGQVPKGAPQPDDEEDDGDNQPQRRGLGSGFIISSDGFVLTNAHVVADADGIFVTLTDKREFKAKLVGSDVRSDVAVLKIEAQNLPIVKVGDVAKLKVGEWVMAIGSPFGFDNTVTAGIVSAKQRDTGDFLRLIQTDVAINPGNSGGPLLNMRGEVVGINSQIYSRSGGFMGISFAIPIDEAMRVADQLRGGGKVVRGFIGVLPDDLSKEVAEAIGLGGKATGSLIRNVTAGGPADKAGLQGGDVVTKIDGQSIENTGELRRAIATVKPGAKVVMQVFRRGAYKNLTVVVAEMPSDAQALAAEDEEGNKTESAAALASLGLEVAELTDAQKKEFKLTGALRVESVDGPAARVGLREGDLILAINNQELANIKQAQALLAKAEKGKPVNLLVRRGDITNFVLIRPTR
ncbi:MAG: DegQ family serine endoprotease [Paucibacter sp.]|nr:DegQ family serine endoprotease [Roseateles sp.]